MMTNVERISERSRLITLLLGLFFGLFGFHRIFTGYRTSGIVQLFVSLISLILISVTFWINHTLFDPQRIHAISLYNVLLVFGLMGAMAIPLVLVLSWVAFDVVRIVFNRFDDVDGHRVALWVVKTHF